MRTMFDDAATLLGVASLKTQAIGQGHSSHQHWKITFKNHSWFLNQFDANASTASKASRIARELWAAKHDLGPGNLIQDTKMRFFITDYLCPTPTPWWHDEKALIDLAERIKWMHALPLENPLPAIDAQTRLNVLWQAHAHQTWWQDTQRDFMDNLTPSKPTAWSHQDLHPLNARWDGKRMWICDWEFAGVGDPASDVMMLHQYLQPRQQPCWLKHTTPISDQKGMHQHIVHTALCCLWAFEQAKAHAPQQALKANTRLPHFHNAFLEGTFKGETKDYLALFAAAYHSWQDALIGNK